MNGGWAVAYVGGSYISLWKTTLKYKKMLVV